MKVVQINIKGHKHTYDSTDINAAATSQTVNLHIPGAGGYILGIRAKVKTAFAGVTGPSVKVGFTGMTDSLIPKQDISVAKNLVVGKIHQFFCQGMDAFGSSATSHENIDITFESTSGNLSSLSAGSIEFLVIYAE